MAGDFSDLEIRIQEQRPEGYPVHVTFSGEVDFERGFLDPGLLPWTPGISEEEDGERLFQSLFATAPLRRAWAESRGLDERRRVRLRIDPQAAELHNLPWELLRDPTCTVTETLAASARTPFSRYLPVPRRHGGKVLERPVRLVAAVADPADLDSYDLPRLDPETELAPLVSAVAGHRDLALTRLAPPATLPALEEGLAGRAHVLHLICHGLWDAHGERPYLLLESMDGAAERVSGQRLAEAVGRVAGPLRLVFLASCNSARSSPADAFRGVAQLLIAAGVPAVVAMLEPVAIDTAHLFTTAFYQHLAQHGRVDLACNQARARLLAADLPGAGVPVLFQRLRSAQLFERCGRLMGVSEEDFWPALLGSIEREECVPLLGPGITGGLLPAPAELSRQLARRHDYPLAGCERLPEVAQYLAATLDPRLLRQRLVGLLARGLQRRVGLEPRAADEEGALNTALEDVWPQLEEQWEEDEIHHQLAAFELPLYLTTNIDGTMARALGARGLAARQEVLDPRRLDAARGAGFPDLETPPSGERPVVLHLNGVDRDLLSLVVTEDDHLDCLVALGRNHEHALATSVGEQMTRSTLLFLGFRLEELSFKVILRGLLPHLDLRRWRRCHVAIQLAETELSARQRVKVRQYLRRYFGDLDIEVYWGSCHQFVAEIHARWQERRRGR